MICYKAKGGVNLAGYDPTIRTAITKEHYLSRLTGDSGWSFPPATCNYSILNSFFFMFPHHSGSWIMVIVARKGDLRIPGSGKKSTFSAAKPGKS
jgi:hypothetical protein